MIRGTISRTSKEYPNFNAMRLFRIRDRVATASIAQEAKRHLRRLHLSYRAAAPLLGVTFQWLSDVLNNRRTSVRLIHSILNLKPMEAA
jgi:hypothetical protein